jgi:O-methyltransferase
MKSSGDINNSFEKMWSHFINITGINYEPYVKISDGSEMSAFDKETHVIINQQRRQIQKFHFFLNSFDFLNDSAVAGDYYEFGVHKARTFRMALTAAKFFAMDSMYFRAFDSFEGLPDFGYIPTKLWTPGSLCTSESDFKNIIEQHGVYVERVSCFKGFYHDTLTLELQKNFIEIGAPAKMVTVDCDLYDSAKCVFDFIDPLLQHGTILYLDVFFAGFSRTSQGGVRQAFLEFEPKSNFKFLPHLSVGWWGKSFIVSDR